MPTDPLVLQFDAALGQADRAIIDTARQFARDVVAPRAAAWQRTRQFPLESLRAACAANLAAIELPPARGGLGLGFGAKLRVAEELARADFGFAFSLVNHHNALLRVAEAPRPIASRLLERMLSGEIIGTSAYTEPGHGSDLGHLETRAERVEHGWQLSGSKTWITNAVAADVFLTLAQTDPAAGSRGIGLFLVESAAAGFTRQAALDLIAGHAAGLGSFRLQEVQVEDDALLIAPGTAFRQALDSINGARCYVAAMCAGMLDEALQSAARYARRRSAFGHQVLDFQGVRWSLVDAATDLSALRLLTYRAAHLIACQQPADEAAAMAKKFAGDRVLAHLANCIQAMGANGLKDDEPLARYLNAAKMACFADGTTEMMNERIGKFLVQRAAAT